MKLPMIFMTDGYAIHVRFPKPNDGKNVRLGNNGDLPVDAYETGSPSKIALEWANEFPHVECVFQQGDCYNVIFRFAFFKDALSFKNDFMLKVHGVK